MDAIPRQASVVVIGAGPTGLTVASLLATYGVTPIVLEKAPQPFDLPRAIVLDDEGARTLQVIGLHDSYVSGANAAVGSAYFDETGACFARTGAGPENFGFPKRSYIYQPEMEAALRDRLDQLAPGALRHGCEVTAIEHRGDHTLLSVATPDGPHRIAADWVLACDGGRSPTRDRLGIAMTGKTYGQDWIVIDTRNDPDQDQFSKFHCSSERPQLTVPAPHGGRRYEFMMLPGETPQQVLAPEFIADLLRPYRGAVDQSDMIRKTVYTFHARIAERFRENRVLLLGDAAHLTPPFAGQGMNAGLRDAHNVAWKLAATLQGGADPAILDSYFAERRDPAWDMILLAVAMGDIVMPLDPAALQFRRLLLQALEPFPRVRDYLIQMKFKPRPRYATGLFIGLDAPEFEADLTGEMIPQPFVDSAAGQLRLDDILGAGFALIAQDHAGAMALSRIDAATLAGLPLARICLQTDPAVALAEGWTRIADPRFARPFRTHRDRILLIRPDRYCAASIAPEALPDLMGRFQRSLGIATVSPESATV